MSHKTTDTLQSPVKQAGKKTIPGPERSKPEKPSVQDSTEQNLKTEENSMTFTQRPDQAIIMSIGFPVNGKYSERRANPKLSRQDAMTRLKEMANLNSED